MTVANPYFLYPFAVDGGPSDVVAIDNTGGTTGVMSYEYGFTPNYEEDLSTISSALPVPRPQFNQLMLDVTSALQQLQLAGAPLWVAPATGSPPVGGPTGGYPVYARVAYTPLTGVYAGIFQIWESVAGTATGGNMSVPGADNNWVVVSGARGLAPGAYIDSASPNGYVGALLCDGSSYVRATYPLLFQALTFTASCITTSSVSITVPSNVIALVSAYLPTSGNSTRCYVEASNIATGTYITVVGATSITISAAASSSGTFTLTFLPYGYGASGINATNFGVPNCLRSVNVASGGSGNTFLGNKLGNSGGGDTYTMQSSDIANHNHPNSITSTNYFSTLNGTVGTSRKYLVTSDSAGATATTLPDTIGTKPTTQTSPPTPTGMSVIQQSNVVFRYVKY